MLKAILISFIYVFAAIITVTIEVAINGLLAYVAWHALFIGGFVSAPTAVGSATLGVFLWVTSLYLRGTLRLSRATKGD